MNIKVGDKFVRQVDGECDSWTVSYTVIKVTAKTVTIARDNRPEEILARRVKSDHKGQAYVNISDYSFATLSN